VIRTLVESKIIEVTPYEEMSTKQPPLLFSKIKQNSSSLLGLARGGTTLGIYNKLVQDHCLNNTSYRYIRTLNLDEYIGFAENNPQSYRMYLNNQLFNHVGLPIQQTYIRRNS
jgi:glucosamine-6-phosphate deaminase